VSMKSAQDHQNDTADNKLSNGGLMSRLMRHVTGVMQSFRRHLSVITEKGGTGSRCK
jgi:hypothetical protein